MTNKDKYNLTEEQIKEIAQGIDIIIQNDEDVENIEQATIVFFNKQVKPTLTEEERVILSNIDTFIVERIGRNKESHLYLWIGEENKHIFVGFDKLFQFIQERRRI